MPCRAFLVFAFLACGTPSAAQRLTVAELLARGEPETLYEIEGDVVCRANWRFLFRDATGGLLVDDTAVRAPTPGSHVLATVIRTRPPATVVRTQPQKDPKNGIPGIVLKSATILGRNPEATTPTDIRPADVSRPDQFAYRRVTVHGKVTEVIHDEVDPGYVFLLIEADGARAVVPVLLIHTKSFPTDNELTDAEVSATGIFLPTADSGRFHLGAHIIDYEGTGVTIVRSAPANPFRDSPEAAFDAPSVEQAKRVICRRRTTGRVIALFGKTSAFLALSDGQRIRVRFASGTVRPPVGETITVAGFVRSDLFFPHLSNAIWQKAPSDITPADDTAETVSARDLMFKSGRLKINYGYDGRLIRLRGRITDSYTFTDGRIRLVLNSDNISVSVEAPKIPLPEVGSVVEVTGACLITETSEMTDDFVRLDGFSVILRADHDLKVLVRPPWWTPRRLFVVVLTLVGAIFGVLVWNTLLRRLVSCRSRELLHETLAHERANLRVDERMRLAVELHDSIVQNMTGVSMQFDAVEQALATHSPALPRIVAKTRKTLDACCRELRDCLWDLRNDSLEDPDVGTAVRKALEPHLGETTAEINLPLQRGKIPDATFHAILSIIRELSVNAIRHGGASHLVISGKRTDDTIRFSVADDGCGFDPSLRGGADEGHFGLQGVEERLERLGGHMTIDSAPGCGARIAVEIPL